MRIQLQGLVHAFFVTLEALVGGEKCSMLVGIRKGCKCCTVFCHCRVLRFLNLACGSTGKKVAECSYIIGAFTLNANHLFLVARLSKWVCCQQR